MFNIFSINSYLSPSIHVADGDGDGDGDGDEDGNRTVASYPDSVRRTFSNIRPLSNHFVISLR